MTNVEHLSSLIVAALLKQLKRGGAGDVDEDDESTTTMKLTSEKHRYVPPTALEYASASALPRHLAFDPETGLCSVQSSAASSDANVVNLSETGVSKMLRNESLVKSARARAKIDATKAPRSGAGWFNMESSTVDERARSDMQALAVRHIADPARRYKVEHRGAAGSRFFQLGTVIEGRGEFYSSRLKRKERKTSLTDELLDNRDVRDLVKKRMKAAADEAPYRKREKNERQKPKKKKNKR
jgi:hypothetical protein